MRELLERYPVRKWRMLVDDEDISARFILWEALNVRSVSQTLKMSLDTAEWKRNAGHALKC